MSECFAAFSTCSSSRDKSPFTPEAPDVQCCSKTHDSLTLGAFIVNPTDAEVQGLHVEIAGWLSWSPPVGVGAAELDGDQTWKMVVPNLQHSTAYDIRMRGYNKHGDGPWSRKQFMTSQVPEAPVKFLCSQRYPDRLELQWEVADPEGSPVTSCVLKISGPFGWSIAELDTKEGPRRKDKIVWEGVVVKLAGATQYSVSVAAVNGAGMGASTEGKFKTSDAPMQPHPVDCTVRKVNFLELEWEVEEPDGAPIERCEMQEKGSLGWYDLSFDKPGSSGPSPVKDIRWQASLSELEGNTDYNLRIRGVNRVGPGPWATVIMSTSQLPRAPTELVCKKRLPNGLVLGWKLGDPEGHDAVLTGCKVTVPAWFSSGELNFSKEPQRGGANGAKGEANLWQAAVTDLNAETDYEIFVAGANVVGVGPATSAKFKTAERPLAPTKFVCRSRGATLLEVTWEVEDPEGAEVQSCSVEIEGSIAWSGATYKSGGEPKRVEGSPTQWQATVSDLELDTFYKMRVCADNVVGTGPYYCSPVDFKTQGRPDMPTQFKWRLLDREKALELEWRMKDPPGAPVEECEVDVLKVSLTGSSYWDKPTFKGAPKRHSENLWKAKIKDMEMGTQYKVRISGSNGAGRSARYETEFQLPDPPPVPQDLEVNRLDDGTLTFTWSLPDAGPSPINSCEVEVALGGWISTRWQSATFAEGSGSPTLESKRSGTSTWKCLLEETMGDSKLRVRGVNKYGSGEWAEIKTKGKASVSMKSQAKPEDVPAEPEEEQ